MNRLIRGADEGLDLGVHGGVFAFGPLDGVAFADGDVSTGFAREFGVIGKEFGQRVAFDAGIKHRAGVEARAFGGLGDVDEVEELGFFVRRRAG